MADQGSYGPPPTGPYQPPYGYPYPPAQMGTNTLAILALVFAFVCAPAGIVMGAIARKQIQRTGEQGMGLATAGLVLGIVFTAIAAIWVIIVVLLIAHAMQQIQGPSTSGAFVLSAARAYFGF